MELEHSILIKIYIYCTIIFIGSVMSDAVDNSTDVHEATVKEVPKPTMTIENGDSSDYHLPGYYALTKREPFYVEKDPVTGTIDFSKNPPKNGPSTSNINNDQEIGQEKDFSDNEYYEDDESSTNEFFKEDSIDRKDGSINGNTNYRPNDIDKNQYKISADLHQFLNLPVHYSSSDKFPLISSSYANTKIQGTGTNSNTYSNHRYPTTSSTQSPSYYTINKQSTTSTTSTTTTTPPPSLPPPSLFTTPKPKIDSKPQTYFSKTSTSTTTTSPKPSYSEYEGEDLVYSDYEQEYGQSQNPPSVKYSPSSTTQVSVTSTKTYLTSAKTTQSPTVISSFKPTFTPVTIGYTTKKTIQNLTEPEEEEDIEYEDDNVSIVTSLPVDVYYSKHPSMSNNMSSTNSENPISISTAYTTTEILSTSSTMAQNKTEQRKDSTTVQLENLNTSSKLNSSITTTSSNDGLSKYSNRYDEPHKPTQSVQDAFHNYYGTKDNFVPITDEPFRPIFGPLETTQQPPFNRMPIPYKNEVKQTVTNSQGKPYYEYHSPTNAKPLPNQGKIEFVEKRPTNEQPSKYQNKPILPIKYPGVEPPRPNPPVVFSQNTPFGDKQKPPNKQNLPTQNKPFFNNNEPNSAGSSLNLQSQYVPSNYGKPQNTINHLSSMQNTSTPEYVEPTRNPSQTLQPPFIRLPDDIPLHVKKPNNGTVVKVSRPEEIIYPQQRPVGVIPPSVLKQQANPSNQVVKFHPPMKHDNHFFKVPHDEENPSYSLQTSFSIGVPNSENSENDGRRPGQGIGQVLFPDGKPDPNLNSDDGNHNQSPLVRRPGNTNPFGAPLNQNFPPQTRPQHFPSTPQGLPQRPSPQRITGQDLRPKPNNENYPRPHWENQSKPQIIFNQNSGIKHEIPPPYQTINRIKPDHNIHRPDLPNILPQFRPNAKVGTAGPAQNIGPEQLREPLDTLQPPPLPQPQHLRANRNDDSGNDEYEKKNEETDSVQMPLINRRTGSQPLNKVTTLQMMQQNPPSRSQIKTDFHDHRSEKPVFVVYPTNGGSKNPTSSIEGSVVIGTRGPQKPLPPSNLETSDVDDDDPFPLDDNKQFSIPARDRIDTPILKTKTSTKPPLKNDFPYAIVKPTPEKPLPEERILAGNIVTKEYNAFSPTISSSTEDLKDHDAEINLIPYLQDYMPFATKKPLTPKVPPVSPQLLIGNKNQEFIKMPSTVKPISVTLNTRLGSTTKSETSTEYVKNVKPISSSIHHQEPMIFNGGKNEYTVGAVMHTHQYKKPANHKPLEINASSNQPKPIDLEAPFQASLSAPQSEGWTVVKKNTNNQQIDRHDNISENSEKKPDTTETKFDFENFKPELIGGFKPIIPPSTEDKSSSSDKENNDEKH